MERELGALAHAAGEDPQPGDRQHPVRRSAGAGPVTSSVMTASVLRSMSWTTVAPSAA